jgi:two-component system, OmpR family, KDP operon response regulator KdpE
VRVLVIEDEDAIARFLVEALGDDGHRVERVVWLREGVEAAGAWDVILANGLEASWEGLDEADAAALRGLSARAPVVLASARNWVGSIEPATLGVAAVLTKPYELDELLASVRRAGQPASA